MLTFSPFCGGMPLAMTKPRKKSQLSVAITPELRVALDEIRVHMEGKDEFRRISFGEAVRRLLISAVRDYKETEMEPKPAQQNLVRRSAKVTTTGKT